MIIKKEKNNPTYSVSTRKQHLIGSVINYTKKKKVYRLRIVNLMQRIRTGFTYTAVPIK